jgi:hypothetical protein
LREERLIKRSEQASALDMGDLNLVVPPDTTTTPEAAPEPSSLAGPRLAAPRCRRVHFPDLVASPICLPPKSDDHAMEEEAEPPPPPGPGKEMEAVALGELEDRMDLLWEDFFFNEELLAKRQAAGGGSGPCYSESSDGEESDSAPGRDALAACFPVLRPSARAGGAGHYRRRAGSWVLLMRIFRRLFVIDKTASPRQRAASSRAR